MPAVFGRILSYEVRESPVNPRDKAYGHRYGAHTVACLVSIGTSLPHARMDQTAVRDFFADQPGAVVLVVCTDLCSLHLRTSDDPEQIDAWAVHPGERSILDRVQSGLDLPDSAPAPSREVLRETGNMSSATVLFILQRILDDSALPEGARVAGVCFGPGLTVESARLTLRDAQT